MQPLSAESQAILERLRRLRSADAATHGGRVLSYVYDSGLAELDDLATEAMRLVQPVNGLDPTVFPSVATLEREVVGFARTVLHGDDDTVGTVTSGGTESCMLAVKTARDVWAAAQISGDPATQPMLGLRPRVIAPSTVHAAFHKAAHYFGLDLDLVPVDAEGRVNVADLVARFGPDVALVVVSAPSYPFGTLDPIEEVASAAARYGIPCHVDACIGGFALAWWGDLPPWDLAVPGVTSISADLHKYGYAPKGASVLLQRDRDRQRQQFFATARWPGYPVVNPTLLGSKSAGALAAAWAIVQRLGSDGFADLVASCRRSTEQLHTLIDGTVGLRVVGSPTGPLIAVESDTSASKRSRVDPHHWADRVAELGFTLQMQPGFTQSNGFALPRTTHLTITPVTERMLPELSAALTRAADDVRGKAPANPRFAVQVLRLSGALGRELTADKAFALLTRFGIGASASTDDASTPLPSKMAPLMALVEQLPAEFAERLLIEVLARQAEPASS
ncbi:pyridoxal phosphate-dependent decarboxylase family protein [Paramicrobacterium agarici]|uniref:Glutamate/tyrosine decarboxylase-like PLP-dependent enzyme n=1 Tax=Paramicrobacterium agarici TaxID=630514 RepID=A0A2A9DWT1_9MICO|nr:aminotransferase class V-fold PLP-dependent enzyme [Microbacterium agarici]PFG30390.1 glutamate/tyrosine decarboxylase-like PLP-dependent enzyme [Microbacterium agarici]